MPNIASILIRRPTASVPVGNANPKLSTAVYHVLQARLQEHNILIWVVAKKKEHLNLVKVEVQIPEPTRENLERAETWVRSVMILAYPSMP